MSERALTQNGEPESPAEVKKTARRGVAWTGLAQVVRQALEFGVGVVMARILDPGDFGVISACMIFFSFVSIITSFGFSTVIVQRPRLEEPFIRTAQALSVGLGCLSTLVMAVSAHWIGAFYHSRSIEEVIPALSTVFLISGFNVVPNALLTRRIMFGRITAVSMIGSLVYGVTSLSMALAGCGVWSLVVAPLASLLAGTLLLCLAASYVPRASLEKRYLGELLRGGGYVTASSLCNQIARNADNLLVGRYLGTQALGLYARAYNLATLPKELLVSVLGSVLFPSFARIQHDPELVGKAYFKSINAIALVSLPVSVLFLTTAPELVGVVYGPKWDGAVRPFQLLSLAGFIYTLYVPSTSLLLGLGKTRAYAVLQVLYSVAIVLSVLASFRYGIQSIAAAVAVVIALCFLAYLKVTHEFLPFSGPGYWNGIKVPLIGTLYLTLGIEGVKHLLNGVGVAEPRTLLVAEVMIATGIYLSYLGFSRDGVVLELKELLRSKLGAPAVGSQAS